jgi:beta-aspartyl-peptidase (threonine type)
VTSGPGAVVIGSRNAGVGMPAAIDVLSSGGCALDAVEAAVRLVEDNPDDHTVGFGGYPNLRGEVELDASIMDGTTRRAGAVGALRGYRHAITVARAVMDRLPHVLVVGDGAARLAAEIGLEAENLLTPEAERVWRDGIEGRLPPDGLAARMLSAVAAMATDPEHVAGTVNVIARDRDGNLASAVSTSGWAWKYPGRLGDSPIVGAGNYADSRFGAAACTGYGELAIRATTARTIVAALEHGAALADAGAAALRDVVALGGDGDAPPVMHAVVLAADGAHAAVSTDEATYVFWEDGMAGAVEKPRTVVA